MASSGIDSLVFLGPQLILLPRRHGSPARSLTLDVFKFDHISLPEEDDIDEDTEEHSEVDLIAALQFPELVFEVAAITKGVARCEPSLTFRTKATERVSTMRGSEKTFRPSPSSRLVTLSFDTFRHADNQLTQRHYTVMFHAENIKQIALDHWKLSPTVPKIPWEEWGEQTTRWFNQPAAPHWICYSYGNRMVRRKPHSPLGHLQVVDFNPSSVRGKVDGSTKDQFRDTVEVFQASRGTNLEYRPY